MNDYNKFLPKVDVLIDRAEKIVSQPRYVIKEAINLMLNDQRNAIKCKHFNEEHDKFNEKNFEKELKTYIDKVLKTPVKRVINATGTVIHTNLGRAPLSEKIIEEIKPLVCNYSDLEFDLDTGLRGSRLKHIKPTFFGSEDILVVNNNASACLLVLNTLACGKEVIVSRGELVEIGGSFRVPEIMKSSGAILKEVGTTNKTHIHDYEKAINDNTGLILKVHRSNFVQKGFVKEVNTEELIKLSLKYNIPFYFDAGSGACGVIRQISMDEPVIEEEVKKGVDIVSFSGDKLLGGTQAGLIVGKKVYIDNMKKNPLYRALRPDKFTIYYLERLFFNLERRNYDASPVIKMLMEPKDSIKKRAKKLIRLIQNKIDKECFKLDMDFSTPGGGSLPDLTLETVVLKIKHPKFSEEEFSKLLLKSNPPVVVRRKENACIIDFRTVSMEEIPILGDMLIKLFNH